MNTERAAAGRLEIIQRNVVLLESVPVEFLRDVIFAVRVFEGKVELVFGLQFPLALIRPSEAGQLTTGTVNINIYTKTIH